MTQLDLLPQSDAERIKGLRYAAARQRDHVAALRARSSQLEAEARTFEARAMDYEREARDLERTT